MPKSITIVGEAVADQYGIDLEYSFTATITKQSNSLFCVITYPELSSILKDHDNDSIESILQTQRTEMIFNIVSNDSFKKFRPHYEEKIRNNGGDISQYACEIK